MNEGQLQSMLEKTMQDVLKNASLLLDLKQKLWLREEQIVALEEKIKELEFTIEEIENSVEEIPAMVGLYNAVKELQGDLVESPATLTYYLR